MLGKLSERIRRDVANGVAWATAEKRRSAEDREATSASEASPLVLVLWTVRAIPAGKLGVAVGLP